MSLLRVNLDDEIIKKISDEVKNNFIDVVAGFDYTVFKHFKQNDQTTIKKINVSVIEKVLVLSRRIAFDIKVDRETSLPWGHPSAYSNTISYVVDVKLNIINSKPYSLTIDIGFYRGHNAVPPDNVFSLHVGDRDYLINSEFYDKSEFEAFVFQQETVDSGENFGLSYVLDLTKQLRM